MGNKFQTITVNLPEIYVEKMDELVREQMDLSRSSIIRQAIREYIVECIMDADWMENDEMEDWEKERTPAPRHRIEKKEIDTMSATDVVIIDGVKYHVRPAP